MRLTWLADVLRAEGLDVWESPGWRGRGKELAVVEGIVWHHTASSPRTSDTAVHAMLRDGRPDLAGPLSQLGLERDGTFVVVADGRANHNGYGLWGNNSIGIEAYNDGVGEPWPAVQLDAYRRGTAAILRRLGLTAAAVMGHRETDPKRKIDPTGLDMNAERAHVRALLRGTPAPTPPTPGAPRRRKDNSMLIRCEGPGGGLFLMAPNGKVAQIDATEFADSQAGGVPVSTVKVATLNTLLGRA